MTEEAILFDCNRRAVSSRLVLEAWAMVEYRDGCLELAPEEFAALLLDASVLRMFFSRQGIDASVLRMFFSRIGNRESLVATRLAPDGTRTDLCCVLSPEREAPRIFVGDEGDPRLVFANFQKVEMPNPFVVWSYG